MNYEATDDSGVIEYIEADDMEEAVIIAKELWREVDWDDEGASILVVVYEIDDYGEIVDTEFITVDIEPNHPALIRAAAGHDGHCGDQPEDHEWTSEGEGGVSENPGVWSTGGTSMMFCSHCRKCGLHRIERTTGNQRNPGEHDTVEYRMMDDEEIDQHVRAGSMDE